MFTAYKEGNKAGGNNGGGSNKNRRRNNGGGDANTSNNNNEPTKYCWTHGLCFAQCKFRSTTALPTTVPSPYLLYVPTSEVPTTTAIIDSGATSNYCQFDSTTTPCFDVKPTTKSNRGASTQQPYDHEHARRILASTALIQRSTQDAPVPQNASIPYICWTAVRSGCIATFDQDKVVVMFDNHVVLTGHRDYTTGMWQVQIPTNFATNPLHATADLPGPNILQHAAHAAVAAESMPERIAFLHACAGSPAISSFCTAIDAGYYTTWPDLTSARICQHLNEPPTATVQGHLDQQRRNLRPTKKPKANHAYWLPGINETPGDIQRTDLLRPARPIPCCIDERTPVLDDRLRLQQQCNLGGTNDKSNWPSLTRGVQMHPPNTNIAWPATQTPKT